MRLDRVGFDNARGLFAEKMPRLSTDDATVHLDEGVLRIQFNLINEPMLRTMPKVVYRLE